MSLRSHRIFSSLLLIAVTVLAPVIGVLAQAQGPSVETFPATNITQTTAVLWGSVNPNGIPTTWDFADPATGASYCPSPAGLTDASASPITVNCLASGLSPSTSYQYALRASNRAGSIMGNVETFTTLAAPTTVSVFDFALSVTPSTLSVMAGGTGTYTVSVSLLSGITQIVYLSVFGLPAGVSESFYPSSGIPSFISSLVVAVPSAAQSGSYSLTIVAAGGSLVKTASAVLIVTVSTTTYTTQAVSSTAGLYVSSFGTNEVKAYDGTTGAFVKTFASGGGLGLPVGLVFGPDANLYVSSPTSNSVLRYDGGTGAFIGVFASTGGLSNPQGLWFGPDGNLYVSSFNTNDIKLYSGTNGAYLGSWSLPVGTSCGPEGLVFGPGPYTNLYVSCSAGNGVARFNSTGWFMGFFIASGSGGLSNPQGLAFGPDGNLYVSSFNTNEVKRYSGTTGAFGSNFAFGGGLVNPNGLTFGPDGNLYVSSFGTNEVKRYNGATGAYMGTFASGGGLVRPTFLTFREAAVVTTSTTTMTSQSTTTFVPPSFFIEGVEQEVHGAFMPLTLYLRQGATARIQFMIRAIGDFRQRVSLELSGSIEGLTSSFDPSFGFPDFLSTLTLQASPSIGPNVYRISILASGGGVSKSAYIELIVPEPTVTGIATLAKGSLPMTTGTNHLRESTAVVISPGLKPNACQNGRLLISSGGGVVLYKDLDKLGGPAQVIFFVYDNSVPPKPPPFGSGLEGLIDDNILVRLTNGDLLLSWEGRGLKTTPPSNMPGSNPSLIQEWKKNNDWARGAIFLWRSSDCGNSWSSLAPIDIATVGDGRCAWPREGVWGGGMDRHEMYVDPWNGNVYVTFQCVGGGATIGPTGGFPPLVSRAYLLTSTDNGDTWASFMLNDQSPSMMTSTPSGRLFIATCTGYRPHIQWLDKPWTSIKGETDVFYLEALGTAPEATAVEHRCAMVPGNGINYASSLLPVNTTQAQLTSLSLSRVSDGSFDTVRLAYPGVIYSAQVEHIVAVRVSAAGSVISKFDISSIHAEELTGSVLQAAFVETDRIDLGKQDKTTDRVLLYWVETSPSTKSMFARYTTMSGTVAPEPIKDLSVSGKRVTWIPNGEWTGDYMYGGFYSDGTNLNFVPQWPQSGPKGSVNLYFNIIKIPYASATSSQCLIATASYGSELSPEVQFLREFRDASIMKTRTGSSFMIVFNAWYYSFSPTVAQSIQQQPALKTAMRFLLSPLIEILRIGAAAFEVFPTNPEAGAILSGLTVSALIGVIYITLPLSVILAVTSIGLRRARRLEKTLILLLFGSLVALGLAEVFTVPLLMSVASSLVALSTLFFSALMSSRALLRMIGWYLR